MANLDLTGKVALVTGGNGGIGLGMAEAMVHWQDLSRDALDGLIEEFVSREGTDYEGGEHWSLSDKVEAVRTQLKAGTACIQFDPETGSTHIMPVE